MGHKSHVSPVPFKAHALPTTTPSPHNSPMQSVLSVGFSLHAITTLILSARLIVVAKLRKFGLADVLIVLVWVCPPPEAIVVPTDIYR